MKITDIKNALNANLSGERLSWKQWCTHLDWAIDKVNDELDTHFPTFDRDVHYTGGNATLSFTVDASEDNDGATEYTCFPDKYIRSVIVPAAVYHFYMCDEEGATTAQQFLQEFSMALYKMLRDYSPQIPEEYQNDNEKQGTSYPLEPRGISCNMFW